MINIYKNKYEFSNFIAESNEEFKQSKIIILSYAKFLNTDLSFQNYDEKIEALPIMYGKRKGCMILAESLGASALATFY